MNFFPSIARALPFLFEGGINFVTVDFNGSEHRVTPSGTHLVIAGPDPLRCGIHIAKQAGLDMSDVGNLCRFECGKFAVWADWGEVWGKYSKSE